MSEFLVKFDYSVDNLNMKQTSITHILCCDGRNNNLKYFEKADLPKTFDFGEFQKCENRLQREAGRLSTGATYKTFEGTQLELQKRGLGPCRTRSRTPRVQLKIPSQTTRERLSRRNVHELRSNSTFVVTEEVLRQIALRYQ